MKQVLVIGGILGAVACAQTPVNGAPSTSARQEFRTGPCPSDVAMPDTSAPLKVAPTRVNWVSDTYQPSITVYGHVIARITIDATGRVEPGSAVIVESDNPDLSLAYCRDLARQRFVPYRVGDEARTVRVDQDFRMVRPLRG